MVHSIRLLTKDIVKKVIGQLDYKHTGNSVK